MKLRTMKLCTKKLKTMKLKTMNNTLSIVAAAVMAGTPGLLQAEAVDDPMLVMLMLNQLEKDVRNGDADSWSAQGWIGYDLNKLWIKTEGERDDGDTESAEIQALYSRAIAPNWDVQAGIKLDSLPGSSQQWGVIGVQGLAPYYFEIDTALFVGEGGDTAFRFEAEYELLLTQKLILTPEVEANFYGQNDIERGRGSGLSSVEAGLRLRYEIVREIAPYIGINWSKSYGNSADYAIAAGRDASDTQWVVGIRAWY